MRTSIPRIAQMIFAVLLLAPITATMQETAERSRTEGLKETDRFVKAGGTASEAVGQAKLQIQKTLDAYNALVTQPSTNMKGDYKKLMKSQDSMNTRVDSARQKLAEMQKVGDVYFNGRARRSRTSRIRSSRSAPGSAWTTTRRSLPRCFSH